MGYLQANEAQVVCVRQQLARRQTQRGLKWWRKVASTAIYEKQCLAVRHYATELVRRSMQWWRAGLRQARLDAELESHKQALHKKVSGWLQEIDVSIASIATA